jgi:hypothetical protein
LPELIPLHQVNPKDLVAQAMEENAVLPEPVLV